MSHSITCDPERIVLFLQQRLSDDEQTAFEDHLDDCDDCRHRLEATAAGADVWQEVRESLLEEDAVTSAGHLSNLDPATVGGESFGHQTVLQLLAPSDDARMLGRLGTYEVVGVIGSGGMGVVLKAFDPALNRYVAIKILAPHLGSSGAARQRFSREAAAAAAVVHDNVIEIYGVDDTDGLPYLVMPYVRGPSLQRRLDAAGPLAVVEILRIAVQAATGLAAAHAQGLVHRDVKPANILLADGVERVKLTDFGLARAADDASLTKTGTIAGTPQYMSPEQARGESVDQRSDLFSLGSVLYAMCAGHAPFRAETSYGVLRRITDEEPRPIREVNVDIPVWMGHIIEKLMSKRPEDRFASASEVARLLEGCLAHVQQPITAPLPAGAATLKATSATKRSSLTNDRARNRLLRGGYAMAAALGLVLMGIVAYQANDPPDISGRWTGEGWGEVVLAEKQPGTYAGSYTDTFGEAPGTIKLTWSRIESRYKGTWREGKDRYGKISVRRVGEEVRGAWTASKKSAVQPGIPELADLTWVRPQAEQPPVKTDDETEQLIAPIAIDVLAGLLDGAPRNTLPDFREEWGDDLKRIRACADYEKMVLAHLWSDSQTAFAITSAVQEKAGESRVGGRHLILELAWERQKDGAWQLAMIDVEPADHGQRDIDRFRQKHPHAQSAALVMSGITRPYVPAAGSDLKPRWDRWEIDLPITSKQLGPALDFFRIEIGVAGRDKQVTYISQVAKNEVVVRRANPRDERRLYFAPKHPGSLRALRSLLEQADIETKGRVVLLFFPHELENMLAQLELEHSPDTPVNRVETTAFTIQALPKDRYKFVVTSQQVKVTAPATPDPDKVMVNPTKSSPQQLLHFETAHRVNTLACSPDGTRIAIANGNPSRILRTDGTSVVKDEWTPTVEILDAATGRTVLSLPLSDEQEAAVVATTPRISHVEATALAFAPDQRLLAVGTNIGQLKLFDAQTGKLVRTFDHEQPRLADLETPANWKGIHRAMGIVRGIAFSPDGGLLAVCGSNFSEFSDGFDGRRRLVIASTGPGRLKVWNVASGVLQHDLVGHSYACAVAFSPDGQWLASAGRWLNSESNGTGIMTWDIDSGDQRRKFSTDANGGTRSLAVSPDGKQLAFATQRFDKTDNSSTATVTVGYPASGVTDWARSGGSWAGDLQFTADGEQIAVLVGRESVQLLSARTGQVVREMHANETTVGGRWNRLMLLPQRRVVIAGVTGKQGFVTIWKLD